MNDPKVSSTRPFDLDLDALLHPMQAFEHPRKVVADPDLTLNEKRAILASWASDACAVEAAPALRCIPGGARAVEVDEILEALRELDKLAAGADSGPAVRGWTRRRWLEKARGGRGGNSGEGVPL